MWRVIREDGVLVKGAIREGGVQVLVRRYKGGLCTCEEL